MKFAGLLLFLCAFILSCDPVVSYSFFIENRTSDPCHVSYVVGNVDTSFVIQQDEEVIMYEQDRVNSEATDYYSDSLWLFYDFEVSKNDSVAAKILLKDRKEWFFEMIDKDEAVYRLRLDPVDF